LYPRLTPRLCFRRLLNDAATTIQAAERGRQVRARIKVPPPRPAAAAFAAPPSAPLPPVEPSSVMLAVFAALLLLMLALRLLAGSRADDKLTDFAATSRERFAVAAPPGGWLLGRLFDSLRGAVSASAAARPAYDAGADLLSAGEPFCEAHCTDSSISAAVAAKAQAELDAAQAELAAARAASVAAAKVQTEIDAARAAATAAAKVKAELEAVRAAAAAAAAVRSELDAAKAELEAARAAAASAAKVQAELDAARVAASAASKVQTELEAVKAAAKVQAELDAAKAELDAAKAAAAAAARLQAEYEAAKAAAAVSAKVQAELDAAKAVADAAARVQAELDAARAAAAAANRAETELDAAKQAAAAAARLQAELGAAKMASCAAKKVQKQLDNAQNAAAAAMSTQSELQAAKSELEAARGAAAAAAAVRAGLRRAREATADELRGGFDGAAVNTAADAVASELAAAQAAAGRLGSGSTTAQLNAQLSHAKLELAAELAAAAAAAGAPSPASASAAGAGAAGAPARDWLNADSFGMIAVIGVLGAYGLGLDSLWSGSGSRASANADAPPAVSSSYETTLAVRAPTARRATWKSLLLERLDAQSQPAALGAGALAALCERAVEAQARRDEGGRVREEARGARREGVARAAALWRGRGRAVRLLAALAGDEAHAADAATSLAALDALRRLTQADSTAYTVLTCGGMQAALRAAITCPASADVAWHVCTLLGNLALSTVLLVRLHAHPDMRNGRAMLLVVTSLMAHAADARVVGAATGCAWTLIMALGRPCAELAVRAGAVPLLVAALRQHGANSVVVYNACGALLTLAQSAPSVQRSLVEEGAAPIIREALDRHGGTERLYGEEVAATTASWLAPL
jgi:hypothetical protein